MLGELLHLLLSILRYISIINLHRSPSQSTISFYRNVDPDPNPGFAITLKFLSHYQFFIVFLNREVKRNVTLVKSSKTYLFTKKA